MRRRVAKFCREPRDPKLVVRTFVDRGELKPDIEEAIRQLIDEGILETTLDGWVQNATQYTARKHSS